MVCFANIKSIIRNAFGNLVGFFSIFQVIFVGVAGQLHLKIFNFIYQNLHY